MIYLELFLTFFEIGLFTFGGGYAMISIIREKTLEFGWLSEAELLNMIAVSESTPGPIAVNMATFIGSSQGGVLGAMFATLGVVLPSFIIILVVASLVSGLMKFAGVQGFLSGLRPVVVGLIIATGITMVLSVIFSLGAIANGVSFDWKALVVFIVVAAVYYTAKMWKKKVLSPILLILIAAILGIILYGLI